MYSTDYVILEGSNFFPDIINVISSITNIK